MQLLLHTKLKETTKSLLRTVIRRVKLSFSSRLPLLPGYCQSRLSPVEPVLTQEANGRLDEGGAALGLGGHGDESLGVERGRSHQVTTVTSQGQSKAAEPLAMTSGLIPFTVPPTESRVLRAGLLRRQIQLEERRMNSEE